jgi:hypothetical protein
VTATATPITTSEAFWSAASDETALGSISFDRCVDWLLDLYQSTTDTMLRDLITDVLDDLRMLGPIEGEFEDVVLGALASIEVAFEVRTGVC